MKPTKLPIDVATATPAPRRYQFQETISALLGQDPSWLASIRGQYDGDWDELVRTLIDRMPKDNRSLAQRALGRARDEREAAAASMRTFLGLVLLNLGRREGVDIFLAALRDQDPKVRLLALNQVRNLGRLKLGRKGETGDVPLTVAEVVKALDPVLRNPDSDEALWAVEYCIRHAYRESLPQLARLCRHPDPLVFQPVLKHLVEMDCDDGTLDAFAGHLLEPGILTSKDLINQGRVVHSLCMYLQWWTAPSKKEAHRLRAAQLAQKVLHQAINSKNAPERLAPDGWLHPEVLLEAASIHKSAEVIDLFERIAASAAIDPRTRANALARHKGMTGAALPVRQAVIEHLFSRGLGSGLPVETIDLLAAHGLVTMAELVRGLAVPGWTYNVTKAIDAWPRNPADDTVAVQGLTRALAAAAAGEFDQHRVRYLVKSLALLPRSTGDDALIRQSLREALAHARLRQKEPWLAREVMAHLATFGGAGALDLDAMAPWDAMREHWRREGLGWEDAVRLLVDAGAMNPVAPEALARATADAGADMFYALVSVLHAVGRDGFQSLRDIGYEHPHDKLFAKLAALVQPPLVLDAVVQLGEVKFDAVPESEHPPEAIELGIPVYTTEGSLLKVVVYHQGQGYQFFAAPQGTWMDAWAVLHAFDLFMERLGRSERAFWLAHDQDDEWALFVCAIPEKFREACAKLRLPVRSSTDRRPQ